MILRESEYKGSASLAQVANLARESQGEDLSGDRAEFIRLVEAYKMLVESQADRR